MSHDANQLDGLSIFAPTADQRFLLGTDIFLRTHFPMSLRRYREGQALPPVGEEELLRQILDTRTSAPGNRLWVLYGAPGEGKSELMKWLEVRVGIEAPARAAVTVRLSRHELDVLRIMQRFQALLPDSFFTEATLKRWQAARQKPRTLTKLLLLFALENLLDSDEQINALFYRLLNATQPYVERTITAEMPGKSIELISLETWQAIINETALVVPLEYEPFRHQMTVAFRHHLLEGLSLPDTLWRISDTLSRQGLRPLLLVDDLVQSLNLFATDMLDYFLTLAQGNWDVVLGLTPAAFEASQRGRQLLERITYLDTIDDRVTKLWLSDEGGHESYVLNEENCHHFAARYLAEYQSQREWEGVPELYPFNREALVRIYRALPAGKGKVRYFLRHLRSILEQAAHQCASEESEQNGSLAVMRAVLKAISGYARTESVARCDVPYLAAICEYYGPFVSDQTTQVTLPSSLLHLFGLPEAGIMIRIEPLLKRQIYRQAPSESVDDEQKTAIRDWLSGQAVNRQLLTSLRRGAARWLRSVVSPHLLHHDKIAQPHGILRWEKTFLRTSPPICLQGIDDEAEGIVIEREIGMLAFDLHRYATAKGQEAKALTEQFASEPNLMPLIFSALDYRRQVLADLTTQLGMPPDEMALLLYIFKVVHHGLPAECPPGLEIIRPQIEKTSRRFMKVNQEFQAIPKLFDDFFKLRKNLYDGPRITDRIKGRSLSDLLQACKRIDHTKVVAEYRLGGKSLADVLGTAQETIRRWSKEQESVLSPKTQALLNALLDGKSLPFSKVPSEIWHELQNTRPEVYAALRVGLGDGTKLT